MKDKKIPTNAARRERNKSHHTLNASTKRLRIKTKRDRVHHAESTSEWAWAAVWAEYVTEDLLGGEWWPEVSQSQMCALLEWTFRAGHRLGVHIAGKARIDKNRHNKIFDKAFRACRRDYKECAID